jgi:hypothetical protein
MNFWTMFGCCLLAAALSAYYEHVSWQKDVDRCIAACTDRSVLRIGHSMCDCGVTLSLARETPRPPPVDAGIVGVR